MRIAFISPEYVTAQNTDGGLANYTQNVARELASRNHQITVFWLSDQDARINEGELEVVQVRKPQPLNIPQWLYRKVERVVPVSQQLRCARRMAKVVLQTHQKHPYDIFHAGSYGGLGFALRKNGKAPLVTRISSYPPLLRSAFGRSRKFPEYLMDWLEIKQILDSDASFAPSELIASYVQRLEGVRPRVLRSPLPEPPAELDESIYKDLKGFSYFLFFGTLSKIKGVDLFADAIPEVLKTFPDTHFAFVGRDDGMPRFPRLFDFILDRCNTFANRLHYYPSLTKAKLYPVIQHAVAVVLPSRIDNYPNACLEAQQCGVPVIGASGSSLEEMIEPGKTGFLVENGNASDLAEKMKIVLNLRPEEYSAIKDNLRNLIASIRSEDRVNQLLALYEEAILRWRGLSRPHSHT